MFFEKFSDTNLCKNFLISSCLAVEVAYTFK